MEYLLLFGLGAIVLSTAQLCLGLWIGVRCGRAFGQHRLRNPATRFNLAEFNDADAAPWKECLVLIDTLCQQVQSLTAASTRCQPALSETMQSALGELLQASTALQQKMELDPASQPRTNSDESGVERMGRRFETPEKPAFSTHQQLVAKNGPSARLGDQPSEPESAGDIDEQYVFTYAAVGYMAPCTEDALPTANDFRPVKCHALSVHTISFYADAPPDYDFLAISVGQAPQMIFLLCRVRSFKEVYLDQHQQYLVQCEFAKRLEPDEICWQDVYDADVKNSMKIHPEVPVN